MGCCKAIINPSTQEAQAGSSLQAQGQPSLHSETQPQKQVDK